MNQQIKTWVGTVIIIIIAITAGVFVWLASKNNLINDPTPQLNIKNQKNNRVVQEKIYAVDDLVASNLPEGTLVKVVGIVGGCADRMPALNEEDVEDIVSTSACDFNGDKKTIIIQANFDGNLYIGKQIVISGNIDYCQEGEGKKYMCSLDNVNLIKEIIRPGKNIDRGICVDKCGNGRCEEIVCMGEGCPCAESAENCPQDCKN